MPSYWTLLRVWVCQSVESTFPMVSFWTTQVVITFFACLFIPSPQIQLGACANCNQAWRIFNGSCESELCVKGWKALARGYPVFCNIYVLFCWTKDQRKKIRFLLLILLFSFFIWHIWGNYYKSRFLCKLIRLYIISFLCTSGANNMHCIALGYVQKKNKHKNRYRSGWRIQ